MRYLFLMLFSCNVFAQTLDNPQNYIINGGFDIWQRGTNITTTSTGSAVLAYTADRYRLTFSATDQLVATSFASAAVPSAQYRYSYKYATSTAETALAADEVVFIQYMVEGNNIRSLLGKYVTLAFWVNSTDTGAYAISLKNSAQDRTLIKEYTVNAANTWEEKYISFYFDPTGTWLTDESGGLRIQFTLACGTDWDDATEGTWTTTNENCTATSQGTSLINSTSDITYITGVRLYAGTQKKPFVRAGGTIAGELAMAQRYYENSYDVGTTPGANTTVGVFGTTCNIRATTAIDPIAYIQYKVKKRTIPTLKTWDLAETLNRVTINGTNDTSFAEYGAGQSGVYLYNESLSGLTASGHCRVLFHWEASAEY